MEHLRKIGGYCAALLVIAAVNVHAAVPASVTQGFTDLEADFESIFALAFPVLVVIVVAMLSWRYFKKLGSKV